MTNREQHDIKATQTERFKRFHMVCDKREKGKDTLAVINNDRSTVSIRNILNPIKFTKSHKVVIMAMGPDHGIDFWATGPEKLLSEIRGRIDQEGIFLVPDEERSPQSLEPVLQGIPALGT